MYSYTLHPTNRARFYVTYVALMVKEGFQCIALLFILPKYKKINRHSRRQINKAVFSEVDGINYEIRITTFSFVTYFFRTIDITMSYSPTHK